MKFKKLPTYTPFNFDHSNLMFGNSLMHGPWVKISARKYVLSTNPFSVDDNERQRHQENIGLEYNVGSINVDVILAE